MASPAPAQSNPTQQQNGNRGPHVNGGHGDQQFKRNGRNPSHKKGYAAKLDKGEGASTGNQEQRPRRSRDDNEANGSPSEGGRREEYRERRGKGRGSREAPNTNGAQNTNGTPQTNGNHVKAEASSSHTEETKASTGADHIDRQLEQVLVDELQEKFPTVHVDSIFKVSARAHVAS